MCLGMDVPLQDCLDWLALLVWIADRPGIEVRRGRDDVALKTLVAVLADLYRATTGEDACRVYRLVETGCSGPFGEDLLDLARPFVSYADEKALRIGMTQPPSLARIVHRTLEVRRAAMLTGWAGKSRCRPIPGTVRGHKEDRRVVAAGSGRTSRRAKARFGTQGRQMARMAVITIS